MAPPRRAPARRAARARAAARSSGRSTPASSAEPGCFVALPLLLAAFTVARPQPLPPPTLPPHSTRPTAGARTRAGTRLPGPRARLRRRARRAPTGSSSSSTLYGLTPQRDRFGREHPGPRQGRAPEHRRGRARRLSARDRDHCTPRQQREGRGANDNASGTAALIELARAFAPAAGTRRAGAPVPHARLRLHRRRRVRRPRRRPLRRALALPQRRPGSRSASTRSPASGHRDSSSPATRARSPAASLVRTAAVRVLEQSGPSRTALRRLAQLLDLGFPFTLQRAGAVRRPRRPGGDADHGRRARPPQGFDDDPLDAAAARRARPRGAEPRRLARRRARAGAGNAELRLPRRALRARLGDPARPADGSPAVPDRTIDLFARCRRRRVPLGPAARSLRSRLLFWGYAGLLLFVAARLGVFPEGEPRPLPGRPRPVPASPVVLAVVGLLLLGGWLVARERLLPRRPARPEETIAGHTVALLALGLTALVVVADEPVLADLPAAVALRLALAAADPAPLSGRALHAPGARLRRPADPRALVRRPGSISVSMRPGTCSRSSRSATSPDRRVARPRLARDRRATRGAHRRPVRAPIRRARAGGAARIVRRSVLVAEPTAARTRKRWRAPG